MICVPGVPREVPRADPRLDPRLVPGPGGPNVLGEEEQPRIAKLVGLLFISLTLGFREGVRP